MCYPEDYDDKYTEENKYSDEDFDNSTTTPECPRDDDADGGDTTTPDCPRDDDADDDSGNIDDNIGDSADGTGVSDATTSSQNCDDCADCGTCANLYCGVNIIYQNDEVIVLDSPHTAVQLFPEGNRYQYELVGGDSAISQANADGSITFSHSGYVIVKILNSEGTFKGYYRVTAILTGTGMNRFSIAYLCCWEEESDTTDTNLMSIDICDSDGVSLLDYTDGFTINMLEQYQFAYHIYHQVGDPEVIWSTTTPQLIELNSDGLVRARDSGDAILRATIAGSNIYCEVKICVEVGEYLITREKMLEIGWNEAKTVDARIWDMNRVMKKYDITTIERIRHFITQCFAETGYDKGNDFLEDDNAVGTYSAGST